MMIRIQETTRTLPFYRPVPLTDLPLIYHREHLFPYTSYGDTETAPVPRAFRMVVLENEFLRVEVAPELGGRVYSLFDKRIGQEILFSNPVVKPVRILPIWAFISGGIEFNFPIAHSPTSIAEVGCATGQVGDYGFIRVGEREARTGMEWVVEIGLGRGQPGAGAAHRVPQPHRRGSSVDVVDDLPPCAPRTEPSSSIRRTGCWCMTIGSGTGLAGRRPELGPQRAADDRAVLEAGQRAAVRRVSPRPRLWPDAPGRSGPAARQEGLDLWPWRHRGWGQATTEGDLAYAEIESGPLLDQSEKPLFPAGTERRYEEFWIPVHSREACDRVEWPTTDAAARGRNRGWVGNTRPGRRSGRSSAPERGRCRARRVPPGIELEAALRRELERGNARGRRTAGAVAGFPRRPEPKRCRSSEKRRRRPRAASPG